MTRAKTTGGARQALTTLMVLALTGCIGAEIEHSTIWLEEFTLTETGGTRPTLAVDQRDGTVYVVWIGTDDGTSNLYLSRLDPGSERPVGPFRVNDIPGDAAPHDQAPPKVAIAPDDGRVYVVWQNNTPIPGRRFPASNLRFASSTDRGETFSSAINVNVEAGGSPASHTFHDLVVAPAGHLAVSWIESRDEDDEGPEIRLAISEDRGLTFQPAILIDSDACPCCKTALTTSTAGTPVIAWRKIYEGGVRDIALAMPASRPVRPYVDHWQIEACPHAGPALTATPDGTIHLAWYTGAAERAGVYYSATHEDLLDFSEPIPILRDLFLPPSQVDLAHSDDGTIWVAWEDRTGAEQEIAVGVLERKGGGRIRTRGKALPGTSPSIGVGRTIRALAWLDNESVRLATTR